ncbi:DUF4347 domain-containing protein, partial [Microcoleus sp. AT9_A5]|uniref:DUF4347 domain-containing protein n=1 Tax=Microcoleus sp. AT9_A5 TaxID=2818625 RepID=UPI002FD5C9C7
MNVPTMNNQIIFVDSSIQDYQSLIQGIDSAQIVILNENSSGITQITNALANQKEIEAIHILSHGAPGILYLGNTQLSLDTLSLYAHQLQQWGRTASQILLYGCSVAAGDAGAEFIEKLHQLTGANIAANPNPTGSATKGGTWELSHQIPPSPEAPQIPLTAKVLACYAHTLGITTRLSVDSAAAEGDSDSYEPSISADGRYVVFGSEASNLVTGDTNGTSDIFLRDTLNNTTTRLSLDSAAAEGDSESYQPSISADGRYVVFGSYASNLVTGDTNGTDDIFLRDTLMNTTTRLSLDPAAAEANSDSYEPSISADGRYVVFASDASNLVTGDTNGTEDIFLRDRYPTITRVTSTTLDGLYGIGKTISITTEFDVPVTVVGQPKLQLETGTTDQYATYSSGSGGKTLTFNYIVQAGDESLDLESLTINALTLDGGTIQDIGGLNAILTLPTLGSALSLGGSKALVIDGIAPTVTINQGSSQADPTTNNLINYTVQFSEPVTVFDATKVTLGGTAGATTADVTGGGTTYNVAVSGMTQAGTVIASINANAVTDIAGNPNTAVSTSTDNQVTFTKNTPPVVASAITDKSVTVNTAFSYTVPAGTFTDAE